MATHARLYVHLVWSTWDRLPLVSPGQEARLAFALETKCLEIGCDPLAIGVMPDHVHVLVRIPPTAVISTLVKELKGSSSHLMTHVIAPGNFFKWQGYYGAFSLAQQDVGRVQSYVREQKQHHRNGTSESCWEECDA